MASSPSTTHSLQLTRTMRTSQTHTTFASCFLLVISAAICLAAQTPDWENEQIVGAVAGPNDGLSVPGQIVRDSRRGIKPRG